jgi:hypothetical protein
MVGTCLFLILIYSLASLILVLGFNFRNRKLRNDHAKSLNDLWKNILQNKSQMNKRGNQLDRYDLLKYNIEESLVIQEEISLGFS